MSLFKAREWWSTTVGEDEEFDQGCLCVANIDNSDDELGEFTHGLTYSHEVFISLVKIRCHVTVNPLYNDNVCSSICCHYNEFTVVKNP